MGVSKNRGGPPKWMVYNGKPYEQMDDLGGFPIFFGLTPKYTIHYMNPMGVFVDLEFSVHPKRGTKPQVP